ncbi:MAG: hypothetical protein IKF82_01140 [Bacilli bacterium]|nr:hypothetical protein [Bacilli bacterium]
MNKDDIKKSFKDDNLDAFSYFVEGLRSKPITITLSDRGKNNLALLTGLRSFYSKDIDFVIVNKIKNTTVVKFKDGNIGKVKCSGEKFDVEKGIAMAILKGLTKFKELNEMLSYFDEKTANKVEKGIAIHLAKKEIGKEKYADAIKNAKIIEDKEDK